RGRFARGEHRDETARAVEQLERRGKLTQLLQRFALEDAVAHDDDQDVVFVGRETARDFLIGLVFGGVRAEELAQRVIDFHLHEAEGRQGAQQHERDRAQLSVRGRKEAEALDAEREVARLDRAWRNGRVAGGERSFGHNSLPGTIVPRRLWGEYR